MEQTNIRAFCIEKLLMTVGQLHVHDFRIAFRETIQNNDFSQTPGGLRRQEDSAEGARADDPDNVQRVQQDEVANPQTATGTFAFICNVCHKVCSTMAGFKSHLRSRAHRQNVAQRRAGGDAADRD